MKKYGEMPIPRTGQLGHHHTLGQYFAPSSGSFNPHDLYTNILNYTNQFFKVTSAREETSTRNKIYTATIEKHRNTKPPKRARLPSSGKVVFRVPTHLDASTIKDQVVLLCYLNSLKGLGLKVPKVLEYDVRQDNEVFGQPYVMLEYIKGATLHSVYRHLPLEDKLDVAGEVARTIQKIEKILFLMSGYIVARKWRYFLGYGSNQYLRTMMELPNGLDFGVEKTWVVDCDSCTVEPFFESISPHEYKTLSSAFVKKVVWDQIDASRRRLLTLGPKSPSWMKTGELETLHRITKEMDARGLFKDEGDWPVLSHWDLHAGNIIVKVSTGLKSDIEKNGGRNLDPEVVSGRNGRPRVKIEGVIDWERIFAAPKILCRKPPVWLWQGLDPVYDFDAFTKPDPLSAEQTLIKQSFEKAAEKYMPGYSGHTNDSALWVQRLWRLLSVDLLEDPGHHHLYTAFVEGWDEEMGKYRKGTERTARKLKRTSINERTQGKESRVKLIHRERTSKIRKGRRCKRKAKSKPAQMGV